MAVTVTEAVIESEEDGSRGPKEVVVAEDGGHAEEDGR